MPGSPFSLLVAENLNPERACRRRSWEQLNFTPGKLGKWQPEKRLPCWVRFVRTTVHITALLACHRTLRLRTPCGEPAKPVGLYAAPSLFQVVCRSERRGFWLRLAWSRSKLFKLTCQIENIGQPGEKAMGLRIRVSSEARSFAKTQDTLRRSRSVPPRGSGWVVDGHAIFLSVLKLVC